MVIKVVIDEKIEKRLYLKDVNDFWLDRALNCFEKKVANTIKNMIKNSIKDGKTSFAVNAEGILYNVEMLNGKTTGNEFLDSSAKLPEDEFEKLKHAALQSFVDYVYRGI